MIRLLRCSVIATDKQRLSIQFVALDMSVSVCVCVREFIKLSSKFSKTENNCISMKYSRKTLYKVILDQLRGIIM